jgi:predicted regulator of Ras-like GTPase activity (Roadblock/LC7/MglB family)
MMNTPAPADLQRWSEEVARDAGSLAFLPLARAYRRQGRREAALRLCLRGLERHPSLVEAHALLALLYFEAGDRVRASDEWSIVLRLDPSNFEALRGLGYAYLEQDDGAAARQHLERAAMLRPGDRAVQEALRVLRERQEPEPWDAAPAEPGPQAVPLPAAPKAAAAAPAPSRPAAGPMRADGGDGVRDPAQLFETLLAHAPMLGAVLLDEQGLVLAGRFTAEAGVEAEALGAALGAATGDAVRAAAHLAMGGYRGLLLDTAHALLHLSPVNDGLVVLLMVRRGTPAGWVIRKASEARSTAGAYMGGAHV